MNWDWAGLLVLGAVGVALCGALAAATSKETARVRAARAHVDQARPRRGGDTVRSRAELSRRPH